MDPQTPDDTSAELPDNASEAEVVVTLRLSNDAMGTQDERAAIEHLSEQLEEAVTAADAGSFDGDEVGGGECVLFFSGASEQALAQALRAALQRSELGRGARLARLRPDADGALVQEPLRG